MDKLLLNLPKPFLILTDANAHHPSWGSPKADSRGNHISQWITNNNLVLLNTGEPTHISPTGSFSHIDLTIATPDIAPSFTWHPHHDLHNSDHFPIIINSSIQLPTNAIPYWKLSDANWEGFRNDLKLPTTFLSPSQACGTIVHSLLRAATTHIPVTKRITSFRSNGWWTPECTTAKRSKNRALTQYKHHLGNINLWITFKKARAKFRRTVLEAQRTNWANFLSTITARTSSSEVWRKVRSIRSPTTTNTIILKENNKLITEPAEVANSLAVHFSRKSNGTSTDPTFTTHRNKCEQTPIIFPSDDEIWYNCTFEKSELDRALSTCKSKCPGPDNIPFAFLQQLTSEQTGIMLSFFNYIYHTGFPHQWREATVIPILKVGKTATATSSYRPIALTNCICKIMEKMINWRLQAFLEQQSFFDPCQSGFRAGHSTLDGLARLEHSIKDSLLLNNICLAVFLDISQAFDTVWHYGLLHKLHALGLKGRLADFIQQFLKLRSIRVRVTSTTSNSFPLYSGVPQGSVLSPTLFTILINDLFAQLPPGVSHSLYADDGALWITGSSLPELTNTMQLALNIIENWSHTWGLQMAPTKTKAITFTRRNLQFPILKLNGENINFVTSTTFLGMILDRRLTWAQHITSLQSRCSSDLRLMSVLAGVQN
uniref:RNA-directed DNA polymerase from mobile element jockey n=1 Tax=Hirondellea gigas TaxID=1518452 RepID=A0A2P2I0P6_9CRUS